VTADPALSGLTPLQLAAKLGDHRMCAPLSTRARRALPPTPFRRARAPPEDESAAARARGARRCKVILSARLIFNWRWGPLTSYRMELNEIDSVGVTGNDIMEIVASLDATDATRELLLDTFMQGFLHQLFLSKWRRFAGPIYYLLRALDLVYLGIVLYQGFVVKIDPSMSVAFSTCAPVARELRPPGAGAHGRCEGDARAPSCSPHAGGARSHWPAC
jgi:hypothetical protein